jgi:hypothetical protein
MRSWKRNVSGEGENGKNIGTNTDFISSFFLPKFMQYRIKYAIWNMDAESPAEAKKKVLELMKSSAENLITVEIMQPKHGVLYRLLWGR